ncbi:hypothetical protein J2Y79_003008 [Bacillus velezensis]|nr:hypothetical protein [Bacillus velezensis]
MKKIKMHLKTKYGVIPFWGQMGTNWGPTCSFLAITEEFLSETFVSKPYKIRF